jgi:dihydroorotase-like cyclic amidohydrolase
MLKITPEKVFFTEEEYPNYETKAKLPTPTRRERRKKEHGH